ncbi:MAG: DsbE family thiol:disulfide interchange protein [Tranquillimonas sp.]|jgi:cytochrome c biogenesis protein CcmG/thiol:disulfide interchange protein DsbE
MAERVRLFALMVPLAVLAVVAGLWLGMSSRETDAAPAQAGQAAPDLPLEPLGDHPVLDGAALRAPGVKVLNFWASWCAPCRAEHPSLVALAEEGVPVYGVNYKDTPENAEEFLSSLGNPYAAIGADRSGRVAMGWGLMGLPETFVIDGSGTIVLRFAGPITERSLNGTIRPAIEAARQR